MLLKDIRDYQILFLSLFLILGIGTRDWTLQPDLIGVAIATCMSTQWFFSRLIAYWSKVNSDELVINETNLTYNFRSPLITALGLSLLLRADNWTTIADSGFLAIAP